MNEALLSSGRSVHKRVVATVMPICTAADREASAARVLAVIEARRMAAAAARSARQERS